MSLVGCRALRAAVGETRSGYGIERRVRAAKIVEGEINLRAVDVNVRIVGEGEANGVVEGENELAIGDVILQTLGRGQWRRNSLASIKS